MSDYTPPDAGPIIDAGIRQYLHSPQVVQALRATLRHAALAVAFENGRAIRGPRFVELVEGAEPLPDEAEFMEALVKMIQQHSIQVPAQDLGPIVAAEVARQIEALRIVRNGN